MKSLTIVILALGLVGSVVSRRPAVQIQYTGNGPEVISAKAEWLKNPKHIWAVWANDGPAETLEIYRGTNRAAYFIRPGSVKLELSMKNLDWEIETGIDSGVFEP